jgi:hypothetical protein
MMSLFGLQMPQLSVEACLVLDVAVDIIKVLLYTYIYVMMHSLDAKSVLNENLSDTQC